MKTIFLDFDNTIVESNSRIIEMMNKKFNINKNESDLKDYGYNSIHPITGSEIIYLYEADDFFDKLKLKPLALEIINKYVNLYNIIVTSKGTPENLRKKEIWIKKNLPKEIKFIGMQNTCISKKVVDMKESIQIDDNSGCLDTNAAVKILYKSYNNYPWQSINPGDNVLCVNDWKDIDNILSFYLKYNFNLNKKY